jgi:hypothetical protein
VLEVVRLDDDVPVATVIAGWGPATQWYLNLEAAPAELVVIGRRRWPRPRHRFLDAPERVEALRSYVETYPRAAPVLGRVFGFSTIDDRAIAAIAERTRGVAFRPGAAPRAVPTGA